MAELKDYNFFLKNGGQIVTDEIKDANVTAGKLASGVALSNLAAGSVTSSKLAETTIQYAEVTLTATEIVGTAAGAIGATAGAPLVAAQAGKVLEFVSAVLIYDYDTAAYTGGGNDVVVRLGTTAVTGVITAANFLTATSDKIAHLVPLAAAANVATAASTINLFAGTAYTQPGTAAGVIRAKISYRVHTTNL